MAQQPRKYQVLADYPTAQGADDLLTLTFAEIEQIIGARLPLGAFTHDFWRNTPQTRGHPSHAWVGVGWRVVSVDTLRRRVTFGRVPLDLPSFPPAVDCTER